MIIRTQLLAALFAAFLLLALILTGCPAAHAEDASSYVKIPLDQYNALLNQVRDAGKPTVDPAADSALSAARVALQVEEREAHVSANVDISLTVEVLKPDWVSVPILPAGTAVNSATVDGKPAALDSNLRGVFWNVKGAGTYELKLKLQLDGYRSPGGYALAVPLPRASTINLFGSIPGTGLDTAVIPVAGLKTDESNGRTNISGTVPTGAGVQISWRSAQHGGFSLSRAQYSGRLLDEAVHWTGDLNVELFSDEPVTLPLLPDSTALSDVRLDDKPASITVENSRFATTVKGKGSHKISFEFESPVEKGQGAPNTQFSIPRIPVSRFELSLPGKKEISVEPSANVAHKSADKDTTATVFVPMTDAVSFSWTEAVPESVKVELRANASIYHRMLAEEGVISSSASVIYEITRGETSHLELEVAKGAQINRISSESGRIADWRVTPGETDKPDTIAIFLDREVSGEFPFEVSYDLPLKNARGPDISLAFLRAKNVQRQRGMVALLSSKELALKPVKEEGLTRVGENQLPEFIRRGIEKAIAQTFKYSDSEPTLVVQAAQPERKQGKFDAIVDTLVSLSDVTMKASATIEANVKSGVLNDLEIELPAGVNFLSLTGPSIRDQKVIEADKSPVVHVEFTHEMEGQFRLELAYERILAEGEPETKIPTVKVAGAEIQQGRVAIEALSAVEVQPAKVEQLSSVDVSELPQQLVLKTTNPILLAYKYVHLEPPFNLALRIARHKELDVQAAAIDSATYQTRYTADGVSVTKARFMVRNSRKQFLRVDLPPGSTIWSVSVDGKLEKPALAEEAKKDGAPAKTGVLIKIINSATGFPVELTYQAPVSHIRGVGMLKDVLPRPDIVATSSRWEIYLPQELSYGRLFTNMRRVEGPVQINVAQYGGAEARPKQADALSFNVPLGGVRYILEKDYANQSTDENYFQVIYAGTVWELAVYVLFAAAVAILTAALIGASGAVDIGVLIGKRTMLCAVLIIVLATVSFELGRFASISAVIAGAAGLAVIAAGLYRKFKDRRADADAVELPGQQG